MAKRLLLWTLAGVVWTVAAGTLLHFVYDRSDGHVLAAVISAVNESTWEHMKLLFVPAFLFSMLQMGFLGKFYPNLLAVRAISVSVGLVLIPVLFYTVGGVLGRELPWGIHAVGFYLSALVAFVVDGRLLRQGRFDAPWQQLAGLAALWALAFAFVWCAFRPPQLGLWQDPVTGGFGV